LILPTPGRLPFTHLYRWRKEPTLKARNIPSSPTVPEGTTMNRNLLSSMPLLRSTAGGLPRFLLSTLLVGAAAFSALAVHAQPMPPAGSGGPGGAGAHRHAMMSGEHGHHGGGMDMKWSGRMLDAVKATPEQRAQIQKIMEGARTDLQAQREAGKTLRGQLMQAMAQPNIDANAVEQVRQRMLAQHDQVSKRRMQAMVDAGRVLTPEQRKQLSDRMSQRRDMMERHHRERRALEAPKS
jgi:Spy/CpxP family protein refolding chaperone